MGARTSANGTASCRAVGRPQTKQATRAGASWRVKAASCVIPMFLSRPLRGASLAPELPAYRLLAQPFAVVPLVRFSSDRTKVGALVNPRWLAILAWAVATLIITLNVKLLADVMIGR